MTTAGEAGVRVLIVEDDPFDAELVIDELRADALAFEVRVVDDESGFSRELAGFDPDIVVSDLSMPGFSGYRALELLRERSAVTPFVFVSGTIGEEAAIEALKRGATDFVLKGRPARLATVVRRALREAGETLARDHAEKQLLRAQRYESLALLAGGISHDLRNILQPLLLAADAIRESADEDLRKHGLLVGDCARRGLEMVASMLSFARGARVDVERVRLCALFDALAMLLRGSVPRDVQLAFERPSDEIVLEGNHTELQQCLLNLCLNALQAMPDGGTLTMAADAVTLDGGFFVDGESAAPGPFLELSIRDTGIGMSDEVRANLFRPFFTTKSNGTGLGLLSCRRIVGNHGGVLRIDSEPGKGTAFKLYFPLPGATHGEEAPEVPGGRGERVLIVVEKAGKLNLLYDSVTLNGYAATTAQSGTEALQKIDAEGVPDVLILDADMSLMSGERTLAALLELDYRGPVILLVRRDSPPDRDGLPPLPRIRFVEKPVAQPLLLRSLREELDACAAAQTARQDPPVPPPR